VPAVGQFCAGNGDAVPCRSDADEDGAPRQQPVHDAIADHFCGDLEGGFVEIAAAGRGRAVSRLIPSFTTTPTALRLHVFADDKKGQAVLAAVYDNLGRGRRGSAAEEIIVLGLRADTYSLHSGEHPRIAWIGDPGA